jgi:Arc/MetJ-type ribon-helix-helix transcriptional regulator
MNTPMVGVRLPAELVARLDKDVSDGLAKDRSEAMRLILQMHYRVKVVQKNG